LFFNAQSLCGKVHDLNDFIISRPLRPLIVGVVETWFNLSISNVCLNMPGFSVLRFDRPTHGGGIMLLVNNDCTVLCTEQASYGNIQVLYCDVACTLPISNAVRFVCVYRPPNSDIDCSISFLNYLETVISPINSTKPIVIMGDFNLTKIDWSVPRLLPNHTSADEKLLLFSQRAGLKQCVEHATHDNNFTDLVFLSHADLLSCINVTCPFSTSDHCSIEFALAIDLSCTSPVTGPLSPVCVLDFGKTDHVGLDAHLLATDWSAVFSLNDDVNAAWDKFFLYVMSKITMFTPKKVISKSRVTNKCKLPPYLLRLINLKNATWSRYKKFRRVNDKITFRRLAKIVRFQLNLFRRENEENILKSASVKKFYSYVKKRMNPFSQLGHIRDPHGNFVANDVEKAEFFNKYFQSVFTVDNGDMPQFERRTDASMDFPVFTVDEVRAVLCHCPNTSSCGPDGCPSLILKHHPALCTPLVSLFNMSLSQCIVPESWKIANVIPIYKGKGSRLEVSSYRPISLTSVFCKVFEKLLRSKIFVYLEDNVLISSKQSGFRFGKTTLSQLLLAESKIIDAVNNRSSIDGVYTDLSKAFDTISHVKLLSKLRAYGINNMVCLWIQEFLTGRSQNVIVNASRSGSLRCCSGVPQGSVLGPLLFLVFINDLPDCIQYSDIFLYADDAKLLKVINNRLDCILFQRDLDAIAAWCSSWQLQLNISKCLFVRYGFVDRPTFDYTISNVKLANVMSTSDLGVIFDSKLQFSEHCHRVAHKGFERANLLLKCFHSRDHCLQMKLFNTFVRPVLEYNSPVWSPHFVKDVNLIERVQKFFTKNLSNLSDMPYKQRLAILGQPTLLCRREYADLILLYKILHGFVDCELKSKFVLSSSVVHSNIELRGHMFKLHAPKPRTDLLKFSYFYRVIIAWNALPANICSSSSLSIFKHKLKAYFHF
jgi:hypothetical protein